MKKQSSSRMKKRVIKHAYGLVQKEKKKRILGSIHQPW